MGMDPSPHGTPPPAHCRDIPGPLQGEVIRTRAYRSVSPSPPTPNRSSMFDGRLPPRSEAVKKVVNGVLSARGIGAPASPPGRIGNKRFSANDELSFRTPPTNATTQRVP